MAKTFFAGPKRIKLINFVFTSPSRTIDIPNWLAWFNANGAQSIQGVSSLVDAICTNSESNHAKIAHLVIYAHASPRAVLIGKDRVTLENFDKYKDDLSRAKKYFMPGVSFVHFAACQLGKNPSLLSNFSKAWGNVDVRGYKDFQFVEDEFPVGTGKSVLCKGSFCAESSE